MKKLFLTIALASAVAFANAQDMTSKKGVPILPEAGDWSIGFDVVPVLNTLGNVFHPAGGSGPYSQTDNTLVVLYVKDDNTAYRAKLRIGFGSTTTENIVVQDESTATPKATVADERKTSSMNITIGGGLQKSRGKGRLKGIYGGELGVMLGSGKTEYSYGNAFTAANQTPTSTIDWVNLPNNGSAVNASRPIEQTNGSTFGIQVNGFIGAEFFFAPKMSVSAEYGWGLIMSSTGEGEAINESLNTTANGGQTITSKTGKSSSFSIDVMNAASIILHCYF